MIIPGRGPVRPWTRQPPSPRRARVTGPGVGLSFLWTGPDGERPTLWKYGAGQSLIAPTGMTFDIATERGIANDALYNTRLHGNDGYPAFLTSDGAGTGDYTMLAMHKWVAAIASGRSPFNQNETTSNAYALLGLNANHQMNSTSGYISHTTRTGVTWYGVDSGTSLLNGSVIVQMGRRKGTTLDLWKDGQKLAETTVTVVDVVLANTDVGIGGAGSLYDGGSGNILLCAAWDRALTDAEMRSIGVNPWQIFA